MAKITLGLWAIIAALTLFSCKSEDSEIGDKFFKSKQYQKAADAYTEYLRMQPRDVKSLYNRGRAYEELGQFDKALKDFHKVTKEDPLNTNALLSISRDYYHRLKDFENTIFYADKVLKLDPNSVAALTLKGKSNQKLGELKLAMESYNGAISINREHVEAYIARGSLYILEKKSSKACADFRTAQSLGSEMAPKLVSKYCK